MEAGVDRVVSAEENDWNAVDLEQFIVSNIVF